MALTQGRLNDCDISGTGGVTRVAIIDRSDVDSITIDPTTKAVTAITLVSGKKFYQFDYTEEGVKFVENSSRANNSQLVDQMLDTRYLGHTQADRNHIEQLHGSSNCGMVVIHEEETGITWIWGINPKKPTVKNKYAVKLEKSDRTTNEKLEDANQGSVSLKARTTALSTQFTPGWSGVPFT
jgi:hypothetical protein